MKQRLLDDFNYPVGPRIDQDGTVVHDSIPIVADAVFGRHIVVCNAGLGQHRADAHIVAVTIRRIVTLRDIIMESRALVDTKNAIHAADDATDHASNDSPDRAGRPITLTGTSLDPSGYPLRQCACGKNYDSSHKGDGSETATQSHFNLLR
jgi:hypothetical protein